MIINSSLLDGDNAKYKSAIPVPCHHSLANNDATCMSTILEEQKSVAEIIKAFRSAQPSSLKLNGTEIQNRSQKEVSNVCGDVSAIIEASC